MSGNLPHNCLLRDVCVPQLNDASIKKKVPDLVKRHYKIAKKLG